MTAEERTRFEVLLENIDRNVKMIAEGQVAIVDRLDRIERRIEILEIKVDRLEMRVTVLEGRVEILERKFDKLDGKVDKLDARFVLSDAKADRRLARIEKHLGLNGPPTPAAKKRPKRRAA